MEQGRFLRCLYWGGIAVSHMFSVFCEARAVSGCRVRADPAPHGSRRKLDRGFALVLVRACDCSLSAALRGVVIRKHLGAVMKRQVN